MAIKLNVNSQVAAKIAQLRSAVSGRTLLRRAHLNKDSGIGASGWLTPSVTSKRPLILDWRPGDTYCRVTASIYPTIVYTIGAPAINSLIGWSVSVYFDNPAVDSSIFGSDSIIYPTDVSGVQAVRPMATATASCYIIDRSITSLDFACRLDLIGPSNAQITARQFNSDVYYVVEFFSGVPPVLQSF
jgi:hypothetical protein